MSATTSKIVSPIDVIRVTLRRLDYAGNDPTNQTTLKKIYSHTMFALAFSICVLCIISIFVNKYESLGMFNVDIILVAGLVQVILKYLIMKRRHKDIRTLVKIVERDYWTTKNLTPKQEQKVNALYKHILKVQTFYTLMFIFVIKLYAVSIIFKGKEFFMFNMWIPEFLLEYSRTSPYHEIIFLIQVIAPLVTGAGGLAQYDMLFVSFTAITIIQLKIIKYKLRAVGTGVNKNEYQYLAKCIGHHNVILSFLNDIERIYSMMVFLMLCTSMVCEVLCLYVLYVDLDLHLQVVFLAVNVILVCQFFLYSLLGQVLMDEADSISEAAYDCGWENIPDYNVRRAILLIIQRGQRITTISVGGLFTLKLETFVKMVKFVGTFLTFIRRTTNK